MGALVGALLRLFPHGCRRRRSSSADCSSALALWTLVSLLWAPSAEATFDEFNRVSLYLAVYVLVVLAPTADTGRPLGRRARARRVAIAAGSFVSRLFPGSFPDRDLATFLPCAATRLSFPLGYWNGLAIFVGLGIPLLLRVALVARSVPSRAASHSRRFR